MSDSMDLIDIQDLFSPDWVMRVNEDTVLTGQRVLLVPYEPHHVPRYHQWMKSEDLQKLTASEPLTLEQEYGMQRSWREDSDKELEKCLDLIIYHGSLHWNGLKRVPGFQALVLDHSSEGILECTFIILDAARWDQGFPEEQCMLGDVNLFLTDPDNQALAEIEVMIAESSYRGRGLGEESVRMMLYYGGNALYLKLRKGLTVQMPLQQDVSLTVSEQVGFLNNPVLIPDNTGITTLGISTFEAKIGQENVKSIRLFHKLHFQEVSVSEVFQEVTLRWEVSEPERRWLMDSTPLTVSSYKGRKQNISETKS